MEIRYLEFLICKSYVLGLESHFSWLFCEFDETVKNRQKWEIKCLCNILTQKRVQWLTIGKIQIFLLIFSILFISKLKKADLNAKIGGEVMKFSLLTSEEFWWHKLGQLTSDKVLYQMVGLCDDNKALSSYVIHFWLPF